MRIAASFWILLLLIVGSGILILVLQKNKQPTEGKKNSSVMSANVEKIPVNEVIDGDTLSLPSGEKVRLIGINAPEKGQPFFDEAKKKLEDLLRGKEVEVEYDIDKRDDYGRTLAYIRIGEDLVNLEMVKAGDAVVETIQPNTLHADEFVQAQEEARASCSGIWEGLCKQNVTACLQLSSIHQQVDIVSSTSAGLNDEWIEVINTCSSSQNISGYLVKDNSASNSYKFKNLLVAPKNRVKLHSGCSSDTSSNVYWQCPERKTSIWNDKGDHAYLYDPQGKLVSDLSY